VAIRGVSCSQCKAQFETAETTVCIAGIGEDDDQLRSEDTFNQSVGKAAAILNTFGIEEGNPPNREASDWAASRLTAREYEINTEAAMDANRISV
jgi:hypothetical protein